MGGVADDPMGTFHWQQAKHDYFKNKRRGTPRRNLVDREKVPLDEARSPKARRQIEDGERPGTPCGSTTVSEPDSDDPGTRQRRRQKGADADRHGRAGKEDDRHPTHLRAEHDYRAGLRSRGEQVLADLAEKGEKPTRNIRKRGAVSSAMSFNHPAYQELRPNAPEFFPTTAGTATSSITPPAVLPARNCPAPSCPAPKFPAPGCPSQSCPAPNCPPMNGTFKSPQQCAASQWCGIANGAAVPHTQICVDPRAQYYCAEPSSMQMPQYGAMPNAPMMPNAEGVSLQPNQQYVPIMGSIAGSHPQFGPIHPQYQQYPTYCMPMVHCAPGYEPVSYPQYTTHGDCRFHDSQTRLTPCTEISTTDVPMDFDFLDQ